MTLFAALSSPEEGIAEKNLINCILRNKNPCLDIFFVQNGLNTFDTHNHHGCEGGKFEMRRNMLRVAVIALGLAPTAALAHVGVGQASGMMHGFMHPLGGVDHLLAMILVGVFAYQLGRKALVLLPLSFVGLMALGGLAGVAGMPLPFVEIGIALSVVVLGLAVAFGVNAPVALAVALVGAFAVFHGHAHGAEMPLGVSGAAYGLGFVLATALLHIVGIGVGILVGTLGDSYGKSFYRVAGGAAAAVGLVLLV
jgi:urease accessory protein